MKLIALEERNQKEFPHKQTDEIPYPLENPYTYGSSLSDVGTIDEPDTFWGGLAASTPPHAIHAAAPKGRPGGSSMIEWVCEITPSIQSPDTK